MKYLVNFKDNEFDLAIVDPPYGIGVSKRKTLGKRSKDKPLTVYKTGDWDDSIPDEEYFIELQRVSKNQIIFGANYFSHYLPPSQGWFVYDKRQPENFSMAHAELAFTSFDRAIRMKGVKKSEMQNCYSDPKLAKAHAKIHQCQKPIKIYEFLLKTYAKEGDKILDTHLGSASIAIACHRMGFDLTGYEIDKEYYDAAMKRLKTEQTILRLAL